MNLTDASSRRTTADAPGLNPKDLEQVIDWIHDAGAMVDASTIEHCGDEAKVRSGFDALRRRLPAGPGPKLSYAYAYQHGGSLDGRLSRAGVRIAAYLNRVLG